MRRTHTCGELNKKNINQKVKLCGWVNKIRDFGGITFIDLRDRFGLTQLLIDSKISSSAYELSKEIRNEFVLQIEGEVLPRKDINAKLSTGEIEIIVKNLDILSKSKPSPFPIFEDLTQTNEELRLKYRYLDIRRKQISSKLIIRHMATQEIRNYLTSQNFVEITTPTLCKSTPEGARDYLVPSRIFPGNFYALPQSPQLFKQLLMIGGMDRYFQIPICYRDEDPRADRQPEFSQVDIEMSFGDKEDIYEIAENLTKTVFKKCLGLDIKTPFLKMSYTDALEKYGCDKPDMRFDLQFVRLDEILKNSNFAIFSDTLKKKGSIKAFKVEKASDISRKKVDDYTQFVKQFNLKGLATFKMQDNSLQSPIAKFFTDEELKQIKEKMDMKENDIIFIAADMEDIVNQGLDHLRRLLAKDKGLIKENDYKFLWVVDFPLFEISKQTNQLTSTHHPFTSPNSEDLHLLDTDPIKAKAAAYDLVLNGYEIAGGSQRIFSSDLQEKIFTLLNLTKEDIATKFGFFIDALNYGTPPHQGIAFGLDRLIMLLTGTDNIRDVIAFPKTLKGLDLMMNSPSLVTKDQLDELSLKTKEEVNINW